MFFFGLIERCLFNNVLTVVKYKYIQTKIIGQCESSEIVVKIYCLFLSQRPLSLGADMAMHSITKYMNGTEILPYGYHLCCAFVGLADLSMYCNLRT